MKHSLLHVVEYTRPGGGPSGYIYNLRKGLNEAGELGNIVDVFSLSNSDNRNPSQSSSKKPLDGFLKLVGPNLAMRLLVSRYIKLHWQKPLPEEVQAKIEGYQAVVFHSARFAFRYLLANPKIDQKIFIMLHQPTNFCEELIEDWQVRYGKTNFSKKARLILGKLELEAYLKVTGILTTTIPSLNAYFDFDSSMKKRFKEEAILYDLPSGVPPLLPEKDADQMRLELQIPKDKFVVGFFGRFHPHKGFDLFIKAAELAAQIGKPYLFLTTGAGSIEPPKELKNLQNLGWRRDIANVVNAVDVVVIPNRVANFDLLALEVMSLGKPIVASAIGGNLYLASTAKGVHLFEDLEPGAILDKLNEIYHEKDFDYGQANKSVYEETYDVEAFVSRHMSFAKKTLA